MSFFGKLFGRRDRSASGADQPRLAHSAAADTGGPASSYVPRDGNKERFAAVDGMPPLRLIPYQDSKNERVLRLCEDSTGLIAGPADARLAKAGIYFSQLRGERYHRAACRAGDFTPGASVRLVREPQNKHDPFAVAVYAEDGKAVAAYVDKAKARALSKLLDAGEPLEAISVRGTRAGQPCDHIAILAAHPKVLAHLRTPRPRGAPRPAGQ